MKRFITIATVLAMLLCLFSCSKPVQEEETDPVVKLEVSGIGDNSATIKVSLTEGNPYGGKLIRIMAQDELTVDPANEIQLINFIEAKAEAITLPFEETLTGLKAGKKVFTAVLVYDKDGRASSSAIQKWETVGDPDGWSTDNSAGNLDENIW